MAYVSISLNLGYEYLKDTWAWNLFIPTNIICENE